MRMGILSALQMALHSLSQPREDLQRLFPRRPVCIVFRVHYLRCEYVVLVLFLHLSANVLEEMAQRRRRGGRRRTYGLVPSIANASQPTRWRFFPLFPLLYHCIGEWRPPQGQDLPRLLHRMTDRRSQCAKFNKSSTNIPPADMVRRGESTRTANS